jgi:GDP/UDP-N,N'-diacetylbacillosamine 2-epimerase (hydrolysing)
MNRRICVVTGSRAEYGLLRRVMQKIKDDSDLELQIIVTGSHLSAKYGNTFSEIESDGFDINLKIEMLQNSDTPVDICKSMGLGIGRYSEALQELGPDLIIVLGDRFEIFSLVSAALILCIPVAHLHGGEITEGAFDDSLRHAITKMSHLHFVAAEPYRRRVIQLGENPDNVFLVGGLGVENINKLTLLTKQEFENTIDFKLAERNLLITYHPVTLEPESAIKELNQLLSAIDDLKDTNIIFTMPNSDTNNLLLKEMIIAYVDTHINAKAYDSLGQVGYLSAILHTDGVVGNSSSGLIEAPSFQKGTINIGNRQKGRIAASSVINCRADKKEILSALTTLYSDPFQKSLRNVHNPYAMDNTSDEIVRIIKSQSLSGILKKRFYNLPIENYGV